MTFYVAEVNTFAVFDIVVEADSKREAEVLAIDEAKKRVRSPAAVNFNVDSLRESDEQ
jgi:hypothetical protein